MSETNLSPLVEVWRYPVKSCGGEQLFDEVMVRETGIEGDREFGVLDVIKNKLCSLKQPANKALAAVTASFDIDDEVLSLSHPTHGLVTVETVRGQADHKDFTVLNDTVSGVGQGDEAAKFFSDLLHKEVRLVRTPRDHLRPVDPEYLKTDTNRTLFSDGYPLTLHTVQSLNVVQKNAEEHIPTNVQFRSNLVIDYPFSIYEHMGFAEDRAAELRVGGAELKVAKASARCVMTEYYVNPETGEVTRHPSTLDILKRLGRVGYNGTTTTPKAMFGQNVIVLVPGIVCVGDSARFTSAITGSSTPNWETSDPVNVSVA